MDQREIDRLVLRHRGVVHRNALEAVGMTPNIAWRQTRAGIWKVAGPAILVHHTAEPGLETNTRITALWLPDAVLTGPSAALLWPQEAWRGQQLPQRAMIIGRSRSRGPWRCISHPGATSARVGGFLLASRHTISVDLLRALPPQQALAVGTAAIRTRLTDLDRLQASARALANRSGVRQLRWVIGELLSGAHSIGEVNLHRALTKAGVTGWMANYEVCVDDREYRLDIAFPPERVYVEYDGLEAHGPEAFVSDRERQNALARAGWLPFRVTNEMLREPGRLLSQINAALRRE